MSATERETPGARPFAVGGRAHFDGVGSGQASVRGEPDNNTLPVEAMGPSILGHEPYKH